MKKEIGQRNQFYFDLPLFNKTQKTVIKAITLPVLLLFLLLFPILTPAQAVSGVTGIVTDQSGAIIPGAQVKLVDTKTSTELTTTANDQGVYLFSNVKPGTGYTLTFTVQGFQSLVVENVSLGIGKTETHDVQLVAGQVSGTVTVTSATGDATLNTTDPSIGNVIGERQLRELPVRLRGSPASLLSLQPGVVGNNIGISTSTTADAKTDNRIGSVTGSRADQQNITVDGIDANDQAGGFAFSQVASTPIDSIQEFRAVSANPSSSEGRSSGGQIQLATKSGTNSYHGSLREFYRTQELAANTFFNNRNGVVRPALRRNQYGASLGGPLPFFNFGSGGPSFISGKDRVFFFFDYERRFDESQQTASRTVPLQSLREGRIGYILAFPKGSDPATATACPSNARRDTRPDCIGELSLAQIAALDPRGIGVNQSLLSFINSRYPLPNDPTGGNGVNTGLVRFNAPVLVNLRTYTPRIDLNINSNQKLFARSTIVRQTSTNALQQLPGDADAITFFSRDWAFVVGHSWVISPTLFNQATVGVTTQINNFLPPNSPAFPNMFGNTASGGTLGGILDVPFANLSSQNRHVYTPTIRDDVTWTIGSHTLQFGGQMKPIKYKPALASDFNTAVLGLGGNLTALNSSLRPADIRAGSVSSFDSTLALLLGRYASISTRYVYDPQGNAFAPGTGRLRSYNYNEYEPYFQDNWKIRNDLTLNLGVRWQYYPAPVETGGFMTGHQVDFDQLFNTRLQNAANGVAGASAEPFLTYSLIGPKNNGPAFYKNDYNNFAPRVGFAYAPVFKKGLMGALLGDRKTAIRGGFSKQYDRIAGTLTFFLDQNTYIFDNIAATNFGDGADPRQSLINDPRFTNLINLPLQNTPPKITNPITPNVVNGVGTGLTGGFGNYTVTKNFEIPYSYQYSLDIQRELPGNFLLDVGYVGRIGRKLFTVSDAAQTLNFKDPASGQFMFDAFNAIQAQIQAQLAAGATSLDLSKITVQPWVENQVALVASRGPNYCPTRSVGSCTALIAANFTDLLRVGGTGDLVRALAVNNLIRPNVGESSQFAVNRYASNLGRSEYNGLLISLQKRFSKGLEFDVNYTFSHAKDNNSSVVNSSNGPLVYDLTNPDAGYAPADFDIRHVVNINGIWSLPFGRGRFIGGNIPKWLDTAIGGWTVSGIFAARSGLPFNALSGAFPVSFTLESPAIVIGDPSAFKAKIHDEGTGIQYFADPAAAQAALRYPHHGEIAGRNTLRGPSFWNLDLAISKKFTMPWSEKHVLSIRADMFNALNNVQFNLPSISYNTTTFGRITSASNAAREVQLGIRYDF